MNALLQSKKFWAAALIILAAVNILGLYFLKRETADYYAVYLQDGKIYVGKMAGIDSGVLALSRAHILEVFTPRDGQNNGGGVIYNLSPLADSGNLLKNDGTLFINRSSILFWERLAPDSRVAEELVKNSRK
jgi:hypothetical protein